MAPRMTLRLLADGTSSILRVLLPTTLLLSAPFAWAGDLVVVSTGAPVVVLRGGEVVGTTPLTLPGLPEGKVELGFRQALLSATVFTQVVTVPTTGGIQVSVNLPERTASTVAMAPAVQAPATAAPPVVPAATAPVVPVAAQPTGPVGDIYVTSVPPGAVIFVDGAATGAVTPFVIRGVSVGTHAVEARSDCGRASASLTVVNATIARADLALVELTGSLNVTAGVPGSRVILDGMDVGGVPLMLEAVTCGPHAVAIRAPGYLEATSTVTVRGDELLNLVVDTGTPAPVGASAPAKGTVVNLSLRKEEFGTLVLDVTPLEAALTVDGVEVGAGPRSIERVAAGSHVVAGLLDGYEPLSVTVLVEPESIGRATLALVPAVPRGAKNKPNGKLVGRVALNVGISAIGLGAGGYGLVRFLAANEAYERYGTVPSDNAAAAIFANEVAPARTQAIIGGSVGVLGIIAASGLWVTTEF
jgi:hypothetical protein